MWWVGHVVGGAAGAVVIMGLLIGVSVFMWLRSRRAPINPENVNDEWKDTPRPKTHTAV